MTFVARQASKESFLSLRLNQSPELRLFTENGKHCGKQKCKMLRKQYMYKYSTIYYIYQQHMTKYVQTIY